MSHHVHMNVKTPTSPSHPDASTLAPGPISSGTEFERWFSVTDQPKWKRAEGDDLWSCQETAHPDSLQLRSPTSCSAELPISFPVPVPEIQSDNQGSQNTGLCLSLHKRWESVQFSRSFVSNSLRPHGPQHARPPCPSPTPGVYSDSWPLSQ